MTGITVAGLPTACTYNFVPDPKKIDALFTKDIFEIKSDSTFNTKTQSVYNLITKDLLRDYLLAEYKASLTGTIKSQEIDNNYVRDWRQLEAWYELAVKTRETARKMSNDIFSYSQKDVIELDESLITIDPTSLALAELIKKSDFLKKWLWYSNGIPAMNPLLVTSQDKLYPVTEKNTFLTIAKQKEQDLLNTQNVLERFSTTARYRNRLLLPVADPDDNDKRDKKGNYLLLEYDRSPSPKSTVSIKENTLDNGKRLRIGIYNIDNKDKISFTDGQENLVYESSFVQKASPVLDQIAVIANVANSNIATFAKVSGLLNNPALGPVQLSVELPSHGNKSTVDAINKYMNHYKLQGFKRDHTNKDVPFQKPKTSEEVIVNGQKIPLTRKDFNEDKKRIIWVGAVKSGTNSLDSPNSFFDQLLAEFIKQDYYYFIDYSNIDDEVTKLQNRFRELQEIVKQRLTNLKSLSENADLKIEQTGAYVRITNRSLPPQELNAITDTIPDMKTILIYPKVPAAPQKYNFVLTQQSSKLSDKDVVKPIVNQSLKIIQTQRFDVSAGIAYTTTQYYVAQDAQPLPTIALGDQFQFTAGLHWYFWKPINRLHDHFFANVNERFSLYAGLSIKKALDNYFVGLSYDMVPGVRLISGAHFYKNYHFKIINNTVVDKASGITSGKFFIALSLQPIMLTKALGLFK